MSITNSLYIGISGLTAHGVPTAAAEKIAALPPVGSVFAAFLGYNPIQTLLGPTGVLGSLPAGDAAVLTGKTFFPELIAQSFHDGLAVAFGIGKELRREGLSPNPDQAIKQGLLASSDRTVGERP